MQLPLLLAGPILRRVENNLASVWVALSEAATVELRLWEGRVSSGASPAFLTGKPRQTLRVGDKLHIAVATVEVPPGKSLLPGEIYSYDLEIVTKSAPANPKTLQSLDLLEDGPHRLALGYDNGMLPSFAMPPPKLTDLNILYGSCRRPFYPQPDALAWADNFIESAIKDATKVRPHQLFLGGDQIYADDVSGYQMLLVQELAQRLIGHSPSDDPNAPDSLVEPGKRYTPVEHVRVDKVVRANKIVDDESPWEAYGLVEEGQIFDLPVDRWHFAEGRRLSVTLRDAQFTSSDGTNHMIGLGEFAALYLTVWSSDLWGDEIPGVSFVTRTDDTPPKVEKRPLRWDDNIDDLPKSGSIEMPELKYPKRVSAQFFVKPSKAPEPKTVEEREEADQDRQDALRRSQDAFRRFRAGLPKVRRALANVPTYMMMDDHDVTDDYFLNPEWRKRVLNTQLGRGIIRNGMVSYALFQDWGNDPQKYEKEEAPAELFSQIEKLFPANVPKGPVQAAVDRIDELLGHVDASGSVRECVPQLDGTYAEVEPALTWHFKVDGPCHRVVAFDNRTRRSYVSINGPPGNVSIKALEDQLPKPSATDSREMLIVLAPLQVIGPPVLDDLVAPLSYRAFDLKGLSSKSDLAEGSRTGLRQMLGTNPDAIEAWSFDTRTFEHLLKRLAEYKQVVLLSGDVHYSASTLMSYWRGTAKQPARFAQFTSSGFKNVMPTYLQAIDRSLGMAQQMTRAKLGIERLGWENPPQDDRDKLVILPEGVTKAHLPPVMRSRLKRDMVLLPTWGWPDSHAAEGADRTTAAKPSELNLAKPPDWRWRIRPLVDWRSDDERPKAIRAAKIDSNAINDALANPATVGEAYRTIAHRHQGSLELMRNARQILFRSNIGQVRFERSDGILEAVHTLWTSDPYADPGHDDTLTVPEDFMVHRASLGPQDEECPDRLRRRAIETPSSGST